MSNYEYYETIKISDFKDREIESFYINPDLEETEKLALVLRKGSLSQKMSFITNLPFYINTDENTDFVFNLLKDKMFDYEQELQVHTAQAITELYSSPRLECIQCIRERHIEIVLTLIVKIVVDDEKSKVSIMPITFRKMRFISNYSIHLLNTIRLLK